MMLAGCVALWNSKALGAEDIRLKPHVGQCDYTFKDLHNTAYSAEALLVNAQTSELFYAATVLRVINLLHRRSPKRRPIA